MKFRVWYVFAVLVLLVLVTAGIAYGQNPFRTRHGDVAPTGQSGGNKFFKPGTTLYAAASATNVVAANGSLDLGPAVNFTVPPGKKADIIATFSGEITNVGPSTVDVCYGVLTVTNDPLQMNPAGGITLLSQDVIYGGKYVNASFQQYLTNVKPGNHSVTFSMLAFDAANIAHCQANYRTITGIANIR